MRGKNQNLLYQKKRLNKNVFSEEKIEEINFLHKIKDLKQRIPHSEDSLKENPLDKSFIDDLIFLQDIQNQKGKTFDKNFTRLIENVTQALLDLDKTTLVSPTINPELFALHLDSLWRFSYYHQQYIADNEELQDALEMRAFQGQDLESEKLAKTLFEYGMEIPNKFPYFKDENDLHLVDINDNSLRCTGHVVKPAYTYNNFLDGVFAKEITCDNCLKEHKQKETQEWYTSLAHITSPTLSDDVIHNIDNYSDPSVLETTAAFYLSKGIIEFLTIKKEQDYNKQEDYIDNLEKLIISFSKEKNNEKKIQFLEEINSYLKQFS